MSLPLVTVSELTRYIKSHIESDRNLQNVWVKGEISNYKRHSSGHIYFTLKDAESSLQCVMFRGKALSMRFEPSHGMQVLTGGYIGIYERDGRYQVYVDTMMPDGIGNLALAYEQLKEKLGREGLFEEHAKKDIPLLPRKVGIVTSPTGAALRDILSVAKRRNAAVQLILYPVLVQGELAPEQIVKAIEAFNRCPDVDVMIVGRGGGSLEELWAFNDERVVRAIFASRIPIISAVGHETDYTLADFVADRRAPTPSAAAEMAVPDQRELERFIKSLDVRLVQAMRKDTVQQRVRLENILRRPVFVRPKDRLNQQRQYVDILNGRLTRSLQHHVTANSSRFTKLAEKLSALSPLSILGRGYSIIRSLPQKNVIRGVASVHPGQQIEVVMADGTLHGVIESVHRGGENP